MSSSRNARARDRGHVPIRASYVIRPASQESEEHDGIRPARLTMDLAATDLAPRGVADPRLVDPYLEQVVERAKEAARREGFEQGRLAGLEVGRREGLTMLVAQAEDIEEQDVAERVARKERLGQLLGSVQEAIAIALDYQAPALAEMHEAIAGLSAEIAAALVGHHLAVGDCTARDAVMRALSQVPRRVSVTLRLNPADVQEVQNITGDITEWTVAAVVADPAIARGDAIAEAEHLEVDASLQGAIERVKAVLAP